MPQLLSQCRKGGNLEVGEGEASPTRVGDKLHVFARLYGEFVLDVEVPPDKQLDRLRAVVPRKAETRGGEHLDFADAILHGAQPYAPAEVGHRTATVAHLGNIAMQLGRKLTWEPTTEHCPDDAEANSMLRRKQREPWTFDHVDSWLGAD